MRRFVLGLALSASLLAQEPGDTVTLLLKGGTSVTGRVVRVEKEGVLLRSDLGGVTVERLWTWDQFDDADPLKPGRPPAADFVAGVEVEDGTRRVRGVVVTRSVDLLVVRDRDGSHRFDPTRVRVTDVWLAEREILDEAQLRERLAQDAPPATSSDHRRAAAEAARLGLDREANDLSRIAEVLSELGRPDQEVFRRIGLLRRGAGDGAQGVEELRRRVLDQSYEEAIVALDRMEAKGLQPGEAAEAVRGELKALCLLAPEERIVLYHDAATAETVWGLARDGSIGWDTASRYVRQELAGVVRRRVADRFAIDAETARRTWDGRPAERQLVASWGGGSLLVACEASSADREAWWSSATPEERYSALRALSAEVLGQVLEVITKDCAACGGRGASGERTCGRCLGHKAERVVLYR